MFLIYFIRLEGIGNRSLVLLFVIFNIAISFIDIYLFNYINNLLDGSFAQYYMDAYFSDEEGTLGKGISMGYLMHIIFFWVLLNIGKKFNSLGMARLCYYVAFYIHFFIG